MIDNTDLLKRADAFNILSDGISGKNPADAKLVADLTAYVRDLESRIQFAVEWVENAKVGDAAVSWDAEMLVQHLLREKTEKPIIRNKEYAKTIATEFYYWWHNQGGTNTQQGFDGFWREYQMKQLGITEEDIHETLFPPR